MKPKALFILDPHSYDLIYGPAEREDISRLVEVAGGPMRAAEAAAQPSALREIEIIFSGWGGPRIDAAFLEAAPRLKIVFYGAGSIRGITSDAFWDRGVRICGAYGANALPVAEYTLSQILFCAKHGWQFALSIKREGKYPARHKVPGTYGTTVGIISLGMIGRRVAELLRNFDMHVIAYDPLASAETAARLGVELVALDDLFRRSDVVTLHTPWLKETEGMITGAHFESMKPGATFINTARGAVVRESEMIAVLARRPDLFAVLDVTRPEPPEPGSPLYTLPNVVLTPHIAGSMDDECRRMGRYMVEDCRRYLAGEPLLHEISRKQAATLA